MKELKQGEMVKAGETVLTIYNTLERTICVLSYDWKIILGDGGKKCYKLENFEWPEPKAKDEVWQMKKIKELKEGEIVNPEASYLFEKREEKIVATGSMALFLYKYIKPVKIFEIEMDWKTE